jgi:nicotinic acid mononucleotide adenylyltransferase
VLNFVKSLILREKEFYNQEQIEYKSKKLYNIRTKILRQQKKTKIWCSQQIPAVTQSYIHDYLIKIRRF